jgi:hypothetical protein
LRASVSQTDARNGTGGADIQDNCATIGDVKLAEQTCAGERRIRDRRELRDAEFDRTRPTTA